MAQYHIPGAFPDERNGYTRLSSYQGHQTRTSNPDKRVNDGIEDVYIAVMGVTGSGKSSFIELCTGFECGVGHSLKSQTQEVGKYSFMFKPGVRLHLIDTPGFDDSDRTDTEVLRDIAVYLGTTYQKNIRLSGIVYFHRIIDPRMQGSAKRNFFMFRKLCGSDCYRQIALVTTWWSLVPTNIGIQREKELLETEEFWGHMYQNGSNIMRHTEKDDRHSALTILDTLVRDSKKITLKIQREMNDGKGLEETDAGQQLNADIMAMRERHRKEMQDLEQSLKEAMQMKDKESADQIAELQAQVEAKVRAGEESQKRLRIDLEKLQQEREAAMQQLRGEMEHTRSKWQEEKLRLKESGDLHQEQLRSLREEHTLTMEQFKKQMGQAAKTSADSQFDWGSFGSCIATIANIGFRVWAQNSDWEEMMQGAYDEGVDDAFMDALS